jgi:transposase
MKNKYLQEKNSRNGRPYQVKLFEDMDIMIAEDDPVRLLDDVLEGLDYKELYKAYSPRGRKPKTSPVTMFKVIVYGMSEGIYSKRQIAKKCHRDINYRWLLNDEPAPTHDALTWFCSHQLSEVVEELFYQLVRALHESGEIGYEHLFVDGTKIEANANKYSFVWKKSTNKYAARLEEKLTAFMAELCGRYGWPETTPQETYARLESLRTEPFVYGRGKCKSQLQRDMEQLADMLARMEKYEKYQDTFADRNSFSKTDPDATFMHMKDDHMRNAQLKPGYNVQLAVEGEYITGLDISSERSDQLTLIPLMERMEGKLGTKYGDVTLDAGYESEENYTWFDKQERLCFIKPQNYERSKTRKFKSNMALRENMPYDAEADEYTCPGGNKLRAVYEGKRQSKSGFESTVTYYECESCEGCALKKQCTRAKGSRKMQVSKTFLRQREESLRRITSPMGVLLRMNRSIQSEGAFGVIKQDMGFRRFLTRGKKTVFTEMLLMAMGFNLNKWHSKLMNNRSGLLLFEKRIA